MEYPEVTILTCPELKTARAKGISGRFVKVVCDDRKKLEAWAVSHGIPVSWIHLSRRGVPHIDLWGRCIKLK